uniref:biotin--[acetyl-CoA-carboxylase] ligase n=1 Tax=Collinsella bouchesdurhonensis TaxID=1907654 RepID=UPI00359C5631
MITGELSQIVFEESVTSTNDVAIERGREGAPHGWCVCAQEQTAGRGRRGHVWASPAGSLYLSVVLRPGVRMQEFTALPAVCAMGVIDALHKIDLGERVGIKWPNDIVACGDATKDALFDRKLAGILVEAKASAEGPFAVVGLGVNLHPLTVEGEGSQVSPQALEPISLDELMEEDGRPDMRQLAAMLRDAMVARVDAWGKKMATMQAGMGPMAPILSEYFDMVPMLGKQVAVIAPTGHVMDTGTFSGLDIWGRAVVVTPAGEQSYPSEAVSLRQI